MNEKVKQHRFLKYLWLLHTPKKLIHSHLLRPGSGSASGSDRIRIRNMLSSNRVKVQISKTVLSPISKMKALHFLNIEKTKAWPCHYITVPNIPESIKSLVMYYRIN
jgi:hypothetical protein